MKVTNTGFRVLTTPTIDLIDPYQSPMIGWKVYLDETQLGEVWRCKAGIESDAATLAMVLKHSAKTIKYYDKHRKLPGWRWRAIKEWFRRIC